MSNYKWSTGLFQCDANQNNGQGNVELESSNLILMLRFLLKADMFV